MLFNLHIDGIREALIFHISDKEIGDQCSEETCPANLVMFMGLLSNILFIISPILLP